MTADGPSDRSNEGEEDHDPPDRSNEAEEDHDPPDRSNDRRAVAGEPAASSPDAEADTGADTDADSVADEDADGVADVDAGTVTDRTGRATRRRSALLWGVIGTLLFLTSLEGYVLLGGRLPFGLAGTVVVAGAVGAVTVIGSWLLAGRFARKERS